MDKIAVKKNTFIFREGEAGDAAYVVETGSVAIVKTIEGTAMRLATIGLGGLFGEMAILDGSPRMASARALDIGMMDIAQILNQYPKHRL